MAYESLSGGIKATFLRDPVPGDFNGDGIVDGEDFTQLGTCFTGAGAGSVAPGCEPGDFDRDGDIDCEDGSAFESGWTGPGEPPHLGLYGDVNHTGAVDVEDVLYIIGAYIDNEPCTSYPGSNLAPCGEPCEVGVVDVDDIFAVLDAFSGSYSCDNLCSVPETTIAAGAP